MATLCMSLGAVCIFDYKKGKIPNLLIVVIFAAGVVKCLCQAGAGGLFAYMAAAVAVMAVFYPLFRIGTLGAGDVKLFGVCAGYFPFQKIFCFLFVSMLVAAIFSVIRLLREGDVKERAQYFCEYCVDVARSGKWRLYLPEQDGRRCRGICLSGPILCSALLCWGGVY